MTAVSQPIRCKLNTLAGQNRSRPRLLAFGRRHIRVSVAVASLLHAVALKPHAIEVLSMKKILSAAAIALGLSTGSAFAADLPSMKGPPAYLPPPPVFSWTGFYVGVNLGGGWRDHTNDNNWALAPVLFGGVPGVGPFGFPVGFVGWGNNNNNSGGVVGGGQIGYNYQFSPWLVVGLETDFQFSSIGSGGGGGGWFGGGNVGPRLNSFGTVRGRIGVTPLDPHFLIYGTGGFAYGEVQSDAFWNSWMRTETGWTAGGGIEWAFLPNWSAKAEYLYTDLSSNNNNGWGWGNNRLQYRFNTLRAGLNYHFNLFGQAPVVAKY
jgi:outer membrane immunogenic protein